MLQRRRGLGDDVHVAVAALRAQHDFLIAFQCRVVDAIRCVQLALQARRLIRQPAGLQHHLALLGHRPPQAFLALKIFGAGYLIWLAVQAIRKGAAFSPEKAAGPRQSLAGNWAMGIAINLLNPKIVLFFMTFLPQFVSATDPYAPQKLLFLGLLFIPISLPVTVPMVLAADSFASMLKRMPRVMRVVDYLFAGIFSAFALRILTASAR